MSFDGECVKQDFSLIAENPFPEVVQPDLPDGTTIDCCNDFKFLALASTDSADPLKNDVHGFLEFFDQVISTVDMTLQKNINGTWVDQDTLDDDTYGVFKTYGFFINDQAEKFVGYQLNWRDVLIAFGPGNYRVEYFLTAAIGSPALEGYRYSIEFCLWPYLPMRADGTVRVEYNISGVFGRIDTDKKFRDYGTLDWYNSFRFYGWFGYPKRVYTTSYTDYNDGGRAFVTDTQEPEYVLQLKPIPHVAHEVFGIDIMGADTVAITDYNSRNAFNHVQKYVQKASGYEPAWKEVQSKLAPVNIKWRQQYNNLRKLRF